MMEIKIYRQPGGDEYLPTRCWYSRSKGNKPRPMGNVLGAILHKISGKNLFPDDKYNKERIVKEILQKYRVGYGFWIDQEGTIEQLVPDGYQSFHAGKSRWNGKDYCNHFMIGIGLLSDGIEFSAPQAKACAFLGNHLMKQHGFKSDAFTSHEYVRHVWNGIYPDNKGDSRFGDPGNFPWDIFRELLVPPQDLNGG